VALDAEISAARDAYFDNAGYEENESLTEAKAFVTACRKLLAVPVTRSAQGGRDGNEIEMDPEQIAKQLDEARRWVAATLAATSGSVIHADFTDFRE
jgi:hypothetical protein